MLPLLRCFFAHLLILQYPDHHQNLISSSLYYSGPIHKISSQSVNNFLSNVVHRQTNKQTDKLTNTTKNITSFAKEVIRQKWKNINFYKNKLDQATLKMENYFFFPFCWLKCTPTQDLVTSPYSSNGNWWNKHCVSGCACRLL